MISSSQFNSKIPSYELAATIATSAGYGAELTAHLKANNLADINPHRAFLGFDKWRSAYPEIPSYGTYLASRRNSTTGKVVSTQPSNITFAAGLKIATRFDLTEEYHVAFPDDSTSVTFWDWIKQYPQISPNSCYQILREAPVTEWADFERECIEESGISPALFKANTQHITNNDAVQEHWDTDEFEPFPVQAALNIPISRSYESRDDLTWNRQRLLFGGAIYAFVSVVSGFFNAKPRIPVQERENFKFRKYESRRKNQGNRVLRPFVSQAACDKLYGKLLANEISVLRGIILAYQSWGLFSNPWLQDIFNPIVNFAAGQVAHLALGLEITPDNYWEIVFAHPELIPLRINANGNWAIRDVADGIPTIAILGKNPRYVANSSELLKLLPTINQTGWKELELFLDREEGNKVFIPTVDQTACDRLAANFDLVRPTIDLTAEQLSATAGSIALVTGSIALTHQLDLILQIDFQGEPIAPEHYSHLITPENYWEIIASFPKLIPIGIAEGAKKALSLCTQGFPCVAILGVTNWSVSGSKEPRVLLPELAQFAAGGRRVNIFFDRDNPNKVSTIRNVHSQGMQLANAIAENGGKAQLMGWDRELGKGIDDAIVSTMRQGRDVSEWLLQIIDDSRGFLTYEQIAPMYELAASRTIVENTRGNYIPFDLGVELGGISVVIADTGSGKTYRINNFIQKCKSLEIFVVIFTPTNKMGKQAAKNFGLPHRNSDEDINEVIAQAKRAGGLVLCPDSIQHVLRHLKKTGQPYVVIFDEAAKVGEHITTGDTIKDRYSEVNDLTSELATGAQSIIIAEAKISEHDVKFYEGISGKTAVVYRHQRITNKRQIKMYKGDLSAINAQVFKDLCDALEAGERVAIPCDSQIQGETIHRMLLVKYPDLKGMRNDAYTSYLSDVEELTTSPNEFLAWHQLDYLIYSPACKAGWDLTGEYIDLLGFKHQYNFTKIYAFFTVLPTSDHIQMIARWRGDAEVVIACPEFISLGNDEHFTKKALEEWREHQIITNATFCKLSTPMASSLQAAIDNLYIHNAIRNGLEKGIARYSLMRRLQNDGHTVTVQEVKLSDLKLFDPPLHQILQGIVEESINVRVRMTCEEAGRIAAVKLPIDRETDRKIAEEIERKEAPTPEERATAKKIRLRLQFPRTTAGLVDLDDFNDVYYTIRNYGKLGNGADLHAKTYFIEAVAMQQREKNGYLLRENLIAAHHFGFEYQRIKLLVESNILNLLKGQYCKDSPELLELMTFCLKYRLEFKAYFKFEFNENKSPVEFWTVLVRKLGLMTDCLRDANRTRHYFVLDLEGAQSHVEGYNQKIVELEDKIAAKQLQIGEQTDRLGQLTVRQEEKLAKCQAIPSDLSEKKQAAAVKRQEKLELSLERIERQQVTVTAEIDRLDGQIDRYQRSIDRSYRGIDKYTSMMAELELRPRLFAAASARLESLTTKLLDRDINSPVGSEIDKKGVKVIPIQVELRLKLPPG
jgi:Domain of unknown function (DUF3854)